MNYKQRYSEAHKLYYDTNFPNVVRDGFYTPPVIPDVITTNGLTKYCQNMITWLGGRSKRVNVVVRASDKITTEASGAKFTDKRYTRSVKKNTADLLNVLRGTSIDIEIKNKHTGDYMKPGQWEEKANAERAGGKYWIVTCVEDFLFELDGFLYGQ